MGLFRVQNRIQETGITKTVQDSNGIKITSNTVTVE
jgi:hypothetical protein